jgi:hypothetical protein
MIRDRDEVETFRIKSRDETKIIRPRRDRDVSNLGLEIISRPSLTEITYLLLKRHSIGPCVSMVIDWQEFVAVCKFKWTPCEQQPNQRHYQREPQLKPNKTLQLYR